MRIAALASAAVMASAGVIVAAELVQSGRNTSPSTLDAPPSAAVSGASAARVVPGQSRFVVVGPKALVPQGSALGTGAEIAVPLPQIPRGSNAVLLEVSLSEAAGPGTVTVASSTGTVTALRLPRAGAQSSATVVARLGGDTALKVRSEGGGKLALNLVGAFEPSERSAAGRVVPVPATQVAKLVPKTEGKFVTVDLTSVPALRGVGYTALLLQFIADVGANGGFVEAGLSAGRFDQKILWNPTTAQDRVRGGFLVVPVAAGTGTVHIHYEAGNVLTADLVGYVTDDAAPASDAGLVVAAPSSAGTEVRVAAGQRAQATLAVVGVPVDRLAGALLGITATGDALGPVTVHAPDAAAPANPTLFAAAGAARQGVTLVGTARGAVQVSSAAGAAVGMAPMVIVLGG